MAASSERVVVLRQIGNAYAWNVQEELRLGATLRVYGAIKQCGFACWVAMRPDGAQKIVASQRAALNWLGVPPWQGFEIVGNRRDT